MTVAEVLADAFYGEGVRDVFTLMGDGNKMWLLAMAALPGVRLIHTRHEGAALAMADGYSRARQATDGALGVCAVTYGPGVTQLSTSLMVAAKHGTPLVVFAADVPDEARDSASHLDFDERALLQASGACVREVRDPAHGADDVHLAFHQARTEQRPVVLLAGIYLQQRSALRHNGIAQPSRITVPAQAIGPDENAVDAAVAVLARSCRPLILVGRGAVLAGAREEAGALATDLGAPVATTFLAKGWMDMHPHTVGIAGGFALDQTRHLLNQADCVLAAGAQLNDHTTDRGRLFPDAHIIQVDIRPHALVGQRIPADVYVRADARVGLARITEALRSAGVPSTGWAESVLAAGITDARVAQIDHAPVEVEPGTVDPRRLMMALDRALPDNALIVIGGGHHMGFAAQYLMNPAERGFEMVFDFMTTGQAVPEAIGAALARPDRPVIALEGDASFMMHVQELETAARNDIPLLVIVMNDGALGAEYHRLKAEGHDPTEAISPTPDLAALSIALGGSGSRITSLDQVNRMARTWGARSAPAGISGPHVVDCAISRLVVGPDTS